MIEIIPYEDRYKADFKNLNLEWLDHYNLTESHDLEVLENPQSTILDRGGLIWMAREGEEILGTAALISEGEGVYELAKMGVNPNARGKGIGKALLNACLLEARRRGAKKIFLFSNHQLENAIHMYSQFGFKHIPVEDSPFSTADVKMELVLGNNS